MSSTYELELDIPYTDCEEEGWAKARLLRDASWRPKYSVGCWFDPITGTIGLAPLMRHDPVHRASRVLLADTTHAALLWVEDARLDLGKMNRTGLAPSLTTLDLLMVGNAIITGAAQTMIPVMTTNVSYNANQPFWAEIEFYGCPTQTGDNLVGFVFGDFFLKLNTVGGADLYWSTDGSRDADKWEKRKTFKGTWKRTTGSGGLMGVPMPGMAVSCMVLPFGRGNIAVEVLAGGMHYSGVYSHPEATYDPVLGLYNITEAGTFIVYVDGADAVTYNVGVNFGPQKFATSGVFSDVIWDMPYGPTVVHDLHVNWCKTQGAPTVASALVDENGDAFVPSGTNKKCGVVLSLAGDGTTSPWVDSYKLRFPSKIKNYTPTPFTVPLSHLQLSDGEEWNNQHMTAVIEDRGTDPATQSLIFRPEINGRLKIDGTARGVYQFKKPGLKSTKVKNELTLHGKNFGVAKIQEKRFTFAPTYGGFTAPDAVQDVLKLAGFSAADILIEADASVTLPTTNEVGTTGEETGASNEKEEIELKSQPKFNSPVEGFLKWIQEEFEPWPLIFGADMKWRFQAPVIPTVPAFTFDADGPKPSGGDMRNWQTWQPWYEDLSWELEPPECNVLWLVGKASTGDKAYAIAASDPLSIYTTGVKPLNYLGRVKQVIIVDAAVNSSLLMESCIRTSFARLRMAIIHVTWRGPFVPTLAINAGVRLTGLGLVQVKSMETDGGSPRELERKASTTYTGILLSAEPSWIPTIPSFATTMGRAVHDREHFLKAVRRYTQTHKGEGTEVKENTTGQKASECEDLLKQVLRGEVMWLTPITMS